MALQGQDDVPVIAGELWEQLQRARAKLRQMAHRYAGTKKKDKQTREAAGADLDQAAVVVALAAAAYGVRSDCAAPAGAEGKARMEALEPENIVASESDKEKPKAKHRWKIVDNWHGGTRVPRDVFISQKEGDEGFGECERWIHANKPYSIHEALTNQGLEILPHEVSP